MFDIINYNKGDKIHFVGIGGVSMSALAEISLSFGFTVSGSDTQSNGYTAKLAEQGVTIFFQHDAKNIEGAKVVVYTAAIKEDNPELKAAKKAKIPLVERPEFLASLTDRYTYPIAVAGTHGKTTVTGMMAHVLQSAGKQPTVNIGGNLPLIKGNFKLGEDEYFVFEACEYKESFLKFNPYLAIVLNIGEDHLDYYKDIKQIRASFKKFANLVPEEGFVVANADDKNTVSALKSVNPVVIWYGIQNGDYRAENITFNEYGCAKFTVKVLGKTANTITLNVPGEHNVANALAAYAAADVMEIDRDRIVRGIEAFRGVERRWQFRGRVNAAPLFDDYAHHPDEIAATLSVAKTICTGDIYVAFQPHTFSRTKALFDEFVKVFSDPRVKMVFADIYAAREIDDSTVHSWDLKNAVKGAEYIADFAEIADYLKQHATPSDCVITMGAGNIDGVCDYLA